MRDLDFDELDKAVNSLLGSKTPKASAAKKPEASAVPPRPAQPAGQSNDRPPATPIRITGGDAPPRSTLKPPSRRGGQVLDVVHPKQSGATRSPSNPSRALKLQPSSDFVKPEETAIKPALEPTEASIPGASSPKPEESAMPAKSEWPDPLEGFTFKDDLDDKTEKPTPEKTEPAEPKPEPKSEPEKVAKSEEKSEEKPVEEEAEEPASGYKSPFLPEAKVEKRPLGAFSNFKADKTSPKADTAEPKESDQTDKKDAKIEPTATKLSEPIITKIDNDESDRPELAKELVDVEAGEISQETIDNAKAEEDKDEKSKSGLLPTETLAIPQQYKPNEKPADNGANPIFDTKEYHPPLQLPAHVQSKSHTIINIVLGVVVLAALAFGGYIAYLYFAG